MFGHLGRGFLVQEAESALLPGGESDSWLCGCLLLHSLLNRADMSG